MKYHVYANKAQDLISTRKLTFYKLLLIQYRDKTLITMKLMVLSLWSVNV